MIGERTDGGTDRMKDEGPAEGKVLHSVLTEIETGGRLDCWWLTDVQGRSRLKQSQEAGLDNTQREG